MRSESSWQSRQRNEFGSLVSVVFAVRKYVPPTLRRTHWLLQRFGKWFFVTWCEFVSLKSAMFCYAGDCRRCNERPTTRRGDRRRRRTGDGASGWTGWTVKVAACRLHQEVANKHGRRAERKRGKSESRRMTRSGPTIFLWTNYTFRTSLYRICT